MTTHGKRLVCVLICLAAILALVLGTHFELDWWQTALLYASLITARLGERFRERSQWEERETARRRRTRNLVYKAWQDGYQQARREGTAP